MAVDYVLSGPVHVVRSCLYGLRLCPGNIKATFDLSPKEPQKGRRCAAQLGVDERNDPSTGTSHHTLLLFLKSDFLLV